MLQDVPIDYGALEPLPSHVDKRGEAEQPLSSLRKATEGEISYANLITPLGAASSTDGREGHRSGPNGKSMQHNMKYCMC